MKKIFNSVIALGVLTAFALTSCGVPPQSEGNTLNVLASASFLADIAQNVAGDRVQVDSLLPVGADPHAYEATPSDVVRISESTVLILNGLEYEHFIESLLENAGGERLVITASKGLEGHMEEGETEDEHSHGAGDPHMWLDPILVITYVENIRDGLSTADPEGAETYKANAEVYIAELEALDAFIREQVERIPAERRLLVTNHEALGYFAERYGFRVVKTILPGTSSDTSASAREVAATIEAIRSSGAPAIFLDEVENTSLANQISAETGVEVVEGLHLESLTDGAPAGTYIEMMKYNVSLLVRALQ
ncbi:MAG TPA: metal ABC transporter substrate-binding protein [Anaerolineales bacterium]|nr:metal ABC transporter substrate-binding protein [Anaerolineales bacterium]